MELKGIIDARRRDDGGRLSPSDRLIGVPLVLWAAHKLAAAVGDGDALHGRGRVAVMDPEGLCAGVLARHGFRTIDAHDFDTWQLIVADWATPFVPVGRYAEGLRQGATGSVEPGGGIEGLRVTDAPSLELAHAVARGLAPDDPRIAGVRRYALPTDVAFRAIVSDVDGCLTNGTVTRSESGEAMRSFNTKDGIGQRKLQAAGIKVGWLSTALECRSIEDRAKSLGVDAVDAGSGHKGPRFEAICRQLGVAAREVVFLGDDIHDLPAMRLAGAMACPRDAHPDVRRAADLVLSTDGGRGAFRELADIIAGEVSEDRLRV